MPTIHGRSGEAFLDVLSFGIAIVWTSRFNDWNLEFAVDHGDTRFKRQTERSDESCFRIGQIHLWIKSNNPTAIDNIHEQSLDQKKRMLWSL